MRLVWNFYAEGSARVGVNDLHVALLANRVLAGQPEEFQDWWFFCSDAFAGSTKHEFKERTISLPCMSVSVFSALGNVLDVGGPMPMLHVSGRSNKGCSRATAVFAFTSRVGRDMTSRLTPLLNVGKALSAMT